MGRQIIFTKTTTVAPAEADAPADPYTEQLLKLIPAESVSLFVFLDGIIATGSGGASPAVSHALGGTMFLVVVAVITVGTPFYLRLGAAVTNRAQLIMSVLAFLVWVLATAKSPVVLWPLMWPPALVGNVVLPLFTFTAPMFLGVTQLKNK